MAKGVQITKTNQELYPYLEYLEPTKVYIPLIAHGDENITILVAKGDQVNAGDMIAKSKGVFRTPIHASIGGTIIDITEKYYLNGKKIKCIEIENDFVETINLEENDLASFSKENIINLMKENGIIGLSGSGFPAYEKYENELKTLIVNAIESDPFTTCDFRLMEKKCEEILEITDFLVDAFGMNEGLIAVKKNDDQLKKIVKNYIGTFVKLKLVELPDYYTSGWERELIRRVKKINYKNYPTEKGIVVNGVGTMYAIYEALKYNKPLMERVVSFGGEKLKKRGNVLVKIGTPITEVIDFLGGVEEGEKMLITNGPLMGQSIASEDLVVSGDLTAVSLIKAIDEVTSKTCIRCGECIAVCPVKLSPVLINEALEEVKHFRPQRCISCGLCSYVCPSHINLRTVVQKAKEDVHAAKN